MFSVTDRARAELARMLTQADTVPGDTFRLRPAGSCLSLLLDDVQGDDVMFGYSGRTVLVVDGGTFDLLSKTQLDLVQHADGHRLGLNHVEPTERRMKPFGQAPPAA